MFTKISLGVKSRLGVGLIYSYTALSVMYLVDIFPPAVKIYIYICEKYKYYKYL